MTVNITLFVQIGNFFLTYLFLHHFFFKPILARLSEKEKAMRTLHARIESEQGSVTQALREKNEAVVAFQAKVQKTYAAPKPRMPSAELDISYQRSKNEVHSLIKEASNIIVKQVPRVD